MHYYGNGYCFKKNGWVYLHIEGNPYERGFQHGFLLAREIEKALNAIKHYVRFTTGMDFQFFAINAERMTKPFLRKSSELGEEIRGIVEGAEKAGVSTSYAEIVGWNDFLELYDFWWPWKQNHLSASER